METKNHWEVVSKRRLGKVRLGGRPSKVEMVIRMGLDGYYEGAPDYFGVNEGASALMEWIKTRGELGVSTSTAKRVIWRLVKEGIIIAGKDGQCSIKRSAP